MHDGFPALFAKNCGVAVNWVQLAQREKKITFGIIVDNHPRLLAPTRYTCFVPLSSAFALMLHCGIFSRCVAYQLWYLHITRPWLMIVGCYSYMESAVGIMVGRCIARLMLRLLINSGRCAPKPSSLVPRRDKHAPNNSPNNELTPMCPLSSYEYFKCD